MASHAKKYVDNSENKFLRFVIVSSGIRRLMKVLGMSLDDVAHATGLARETVRKAYHGGAIRATTAQPILDYMAEHLPDEYSHWPDEASREEFALYPRFEQRFERGSKEHLFFVRGTLALMDTSLAEAGSKPRTAALLWMKAWCLDDLVKHQVKDRDANFELAQDCYRRAIDILTSFAHSEDSPFHFLAQKGRLAAFASRYAWFATSSCDPKLLRESIEQQGLLDVALYCARKEPYAWPVLRLGAVMASIVEDADACQKFYVALTHADPNFADFRYRPRTKHNVLPISEDPDLAYFVRVIDDQREQAAGTDCVDPSPDEPKKVAWSISPIESDRRDGR
jgi:hypothetical protein